MKDTLSFTTVLVTGGGGGLGFAMAQWLLSLGKTVIIAGRTEEKLQKAAKELGHGVVAYHVLDTGDVGAIPAFVEKVVKEHPELDCLVNNAGVQRPLDVTEFDLDKADAEININIRGPMHLAMHLLPHFKSRPNGAVIVNVSSVLGYIPFSAINPVYNGTKAWLHFWSMNLRTQLAASKDEGARGVKVVEIVPPTVATDLHREREDPDDNKKEKNKNALSVEEFIEDVGGQWQEGKEVLAAGMAKGVVERWYDTFGEQYDKAVSGAK